VPRNSTVTRSSFGESQDRSQRAARIREAKKLMRARLEELVGSQEGQNELTALNDALVILRVWEKDAA
jgi:hypothetical protein